jgi:hypothetical protein
MTDIAEPAWGNTLDLSDISFDGLATHESMNGRRNGGTGRGAE